MIEFENLNNQSFEDIVELAKKQIAYLSDDWTNTQESDPGVTLIELFSWLKVLQHDYMNRVKQESQYKFLELLNVQQNYNKGSKTLLEVSNISKDLILPKGTRWCAGEMEFENNKPETILPSKILSVDFESEEKVKNIKYSSFDGKRIFYLFGKSLEEIKRNVAPSFKINFDTPISSSKKINLYFKIFLEDKYKRNPVTPNDTFVDMAKIVWEFYGEKNKQVGWHRVRVLSDDTHRFLFTGLVTLQFKGKMLPINDVYSLRARIIDQDYDFPPKITDIKTNVFEVTQKSTVCENIKIKKLNVAKDNSFSVYTNLAIYGKHQVYIRSKDGWELTDNFEIKRKINENRTDFYIENLSTRIQDYNIDDEVVMIVSYDESMEHEMVLANGTGISAQKIKMNYSDILYNDFNLMVGYYKDNRLIFDVWNKVHDLYSSNKYSKDYILNCDEKFVLFGDNEMGIAPRKGKDNIRLAGLAFTLGKKSNIKSNIINEVQSENPYIKNLKIKQICAATGGEDAQSFDDVKRKAIETLKDLQKVVVEEDYERVVEHTPGLVMNKVKVLPFHIDKNNSKENLNCVTIVIRGGNDSLNSNLKNYEENVKKNIDKYRLVNTKVYVTGPKYIGLSINGQIVVNSYYKKSTDVVVDSIKGFIDRLNEDCGQTLYFGEIFGMIDRLECVSYVDKLIITPKEESTKYTAGEDIVIPPNGVYYIDNIDLSYIKSANI